MNGDSVHTHQATDDDEHVCEGLMCWCVPRYYVPCDECGHADQLDDIAADHGTNRLESYSDDMRVNPGVLGCWKCRGGAHEGLIELTVAEAEACERPLVIVHNR